MQDGDIELFFRFMGYGPIQTAKVWFIGIEPGGESHAFVKDQDRITVNGEELLYDASIPTPVGAERETRVWACSRQMAAALGVSDAFFMSNMAPLPRPSEANRHEGISGAEYTEKVACEYIPRLCAALNECAPKAVIFHGKGAFRAYGVGKAFGLDHTVKPEITHGLEIYEDRRIVVCGNFSRGSTFTNAEKGYVTEKLRGWLG